MYTLQSGRTNIIVVVADKLLDSLLRRCTVAESKDNKWQPDIAMPGCAVDANDSDFCCHD